MTSRWWVGLTVGLLVFLGVSAVPSGLVMLVGGTEVFPEQWVEDFPLINSLVLPGLVLLLGFGLGSLVAAYGLLRLPHWAALGFAERWTGRHWSWLVTVLIGVGQVVWIGLELVYLPGLSFLQPLYGTVGLLLVLLPLTPAVRRHCRMAH
ncbi:MAG TPA: hypothetical protein PLP61_13290 [Nocardioides sp.]|uniref:hypothetical protein n=1 Tax=Nocardioides sp. TaxID=35761 RepID=UPI002B96FD81|nr:hypothetical protein [Nocardioides sp.]HQR28007.1 hypothetical protein [Nocardioides sp.]